jgi:hypothetical protein
MHGDDTDGICDNCGAAKTAGLACCKFCNRPFIADLQNRSVPCWKCKAYNDWGVQQCTKCTSQLVIQCLMCSSLSPHHMASCLRCKEPFAGMRERAAAKHQQAQLAQVAQVGTAVASILGATAAASGRTRRRHRHRGASPAASALVKGLGKLLDDD